MDYDQIASRWGFLLSEKQRDFVEAYLIMQSNAGACDMVGIRRAAGLNYLASPKVQTALKLAQKQARDNTVVTPEEVINDLRLIRDMAVGRIPSPKTTISDGKAVTHYIRDFNPGAANKAVENLGRVVGMFTDKKEIVIPASDAQLKKRLEDLLNVNLDGQFEDITEKTVPQITAEPGGNELIDSVVTPEEDAGNSQTLSAAFDKLSENELDALMLETAELERMKR